MLRPLFFTYELKFKGAAVPRDARNRQPIEMQPLISPATSAPKMTAANFLIALSLHCPAS
jgi:hypothetical protein